MYIIKLNRNLISVKKYIGKECCPMNREEFIQKNERLVDRLIDGVKHMLIFSIVPKFINSVITVKKISHGLGYRGIIDLLRALDEDEDAVVDRFFKLDEKKQAELTDLYEKVFVPQSDDLMDELTHGESMLKETKIPMNVIHAMSDENDEPEDEDNEGEEIFNNVKSYLIDKLFDGVDIVEEFCDDEDTE